METQTAILTNAGLGMVLQLQHADEDRVGEHFGARVCVCACVNRVGWYKQVLRTCCRVSFREGHSPVLTFDCRFFVPAEFGTVSEETPRPTPFFSVQMKY